MNLINDLSKSVAGGKSIPAGRAYLVLWCRVWDEAMVKIDSEAVAAAEAGYIGERNVTYTALYQRALEIGAASDFGALGNSTLSENQHAGVES